MVFGLCGAIQGANTAQQTITKRITALTSDDDLLEQPFQAPASGPRHRLVLEDQHLAGDRTHAVLPTRRTRGSIRP